MKKLLLFFVVITITTLLVVSACKKGNEKLADKEQVTSLSSDAIENEELGPVAKFYEDYGPKAEVYNIEASSDTRISLPEGGTIDIPAGAFSVDGVQVTSGRVDVSVLDLPNRGAMAMRGVNTMIEERVLESNGNFQLKATVKGKPVDRDLVNGRMLTVEVPDRMKTGGAMNLYNGRMNEKKQFDWEIANIKGQSSTISLSSRGTYLFNWPTTELLVNVDTPAFTPATGTAFTTLEVGLSGKVGPLADYLGGSGNTVILFAPQGRNIIIQIYTTTSTGVTSFYNTIPIGISGRLLGYSVTSDGAYSMGSKDISTTNANPMLEWLTFNPTTATDLAAALTALGNY